MASRLSVQHQRLTQAVKDFHAAVQPSYVMAIIGGDPDPAYWLTAQALGITPIFRLWPDDGGPFADPELAADSYAARLRPIADRVAAAGIYALYTAGNEPVVYNPDAARRLSRFTVRLASRMSPHRLIAYNFSEGHPSESWLDIWRELIPGLRACGWRYGRHCYDWPDLFRTFREGGWMARLGRWRKDLDLFARAGAEGPITVWITEAGLDSGVAPFNDGHKGWQLNPAHNTPERWVAHLIEAYRTFWDDPRVQTVLLFVAGAEADWQAQGQDQDPALPELARRLRAEGEPPGPQPPPQPPGGATVFIPPHPEPEEILAKSPAELYAYARSIGREYELAEAFVRKYGVFPRTPTDIHQFEINGEVDGLQTVTNPVRTWTRYPTGQAVELLGADFEGPAQAQDGIGELELIEGWRAWWTEDPNDRQGAIHRPEYKPERNRVRSGQQSQVQFTTFARQHAGVRQTITGEPGKRYRFSIWAYVWSSQHREPRASLEPGDVHLSAGINGSWSQEVKIHDRWVRLEMEAVSLGSGRLLLETRARSEWAVENTRVHWDDALLELLSDDAPAPNPPPPEPPPRPEPPPVSGIEQLTPSQHEHIKAAGWNVHQAIRLLELVRTGKLPVNFQEGDGIEEHLHRASALIEPYWIAGPKG